jgi:hypothetical protein
VAGVPAKIIRSGNEEQSQFCKANAESYDYLRESYLKGKFQYYKINSKL